jgi:hypothetical protein
MEDATQATETHLAKPGEGSLYFTTLVNNVQDGINAGVDVLATAQNTENMPPTSNTPTQATEEHPNTETHTPIHTQLTNPNAEMLENREDGSDQPGEGTESSRQAPPAGIALSEDPAPLIPDTTMSGSVAVDGTQPGEQGVVGNGSSGQPLIES